MSAPPIANRRSNKMYRLFVEIYFAFNQRLQFRFEISQVRFFGWFGGVALSGSPCTFQMQRRGWPQVASIIILSFSQYLPDIGFGDVYLLISAIECRFGAIVVMQLFSPVPTTSMLLLDHFVI